MKKRIVKILILVLIFSNINLSFAENKYNYSDIYNTIENYITCNYENHNDISKWACKFDSDMIDLIIYYAQDLCIGVHEEEHIKALGSISNYTRDYDNKSIHFKYRHKNNVTRTFHNIKIPYNSQLPTHSFIINECKYQDIFDKDYLESNYFDPDYASESFGMMGMLDEYNAYVEEYVAFNDITNSIKGTNVYNYWIDKDDEYKHIKENNEYFITNFYIDICLYIDYVKNNNEYLYNWMIENNYIEVFKLINERNLIINEIRFNYSNDIGCLI